MNIKKTKEYHILNAVKENLSVYKICKIFNVDKKKVNMIKQRGSWFIDLNSNELVFTEKNITLEEQLFHYLSFLLQQQDTNQSLEILAKRKIHLRVINWLESEISCKKLTSYNSWLKKNIKLVGYDVKKDDFKSNILEIGKLFVETEMLVLEKSYYYDKETGYPKGYKLWFIDLYKNSYFLKNSLNYILNYINFKGSDKEYKLSMLYLLSRLDKTNYNDKFQIPLIDFSNLSGEEQKEFNEELEKYKKEKKTRTYIHKFRLKIGIEVGKWGQHMINKGYTYDEVVKILKRRYEYPQSKIILDDVPQIIYLELGAYYNNILSKDMKEKIESTFFDFYKQ